MPAKNIYHDAVVAALVADGWTITDDPLKLEVGERKLYIDLAAERSPIGAEKGGDQIAVEVQSFVGPSDVRDLQEALGQYLMYRVVLATQQPQRRLYLAAPLPVYHGILSEPLGRQVLTDLAVRVLVFDDDRREVSQWIG